MAVVNDEHKYIFVHIFKTAGNSIRQALGLDPETSVDFMGGHVDSWAVRHGLSKHDRMDDWNDYFKFTFVRNPFDWLVSVYHHMKTWGEGWRQAPVKEQNMNFEQYLDHFTDLMDREQAPTINKYQLQVDFVRDRDGTMLLDFIGRFEHLERDVKVICKRLGLPFNGIPLVNTSAARGGKDYRSYYTKKTRKFVEKRFKEDLKFFRYTF